MAEFSEYDGAAVAEAAEAAGLRLYLEEAMRLEPLPPDEERALLSRAARGDTAVADEVVRSRLGLVAVMVLAREPDLGDALEWLEAGNLALVRAVAAFAASGEADFESYAASRIAGTLDAMAATRRAEAAWPGC